MPTLLKVRVTLKGRPVGSFTFDKSTVVIGRDPDCDVPIDNTGISRNHARIERTNRGYVIEDLGSSNGTFLNDRPVSREPLSHDDLLQIGKFALWIGLDSDRREMPLREANISPDAFEGTTVLSPEQLLALQKKALTDEDRDRARSRALALMWSRANYATALLATFLLGLVVGIVMMAFFQG